jgi:hypothetical protein
MRALTGASFALAATLTRSLLWVLRALLWVLRAGLARYGVGLLLFGLAMIWARFRVMTSGRPRKTGASCLRTRKERPEGRFFRVPDP